MTAAQRIEAAYIAGQNAGFDGTRYKNPFEIREEGDLHCAFADGYEDGSKTRSAAQDNNFNRV